MQRKIIVSLILIVLVLAAGAGLSYLLVKLKPAPPTIDLERPPLLVQTVEVQPQTVVEPIVGFGTARADRYARLSSQVAGEIVELADGLKPGIAVKKDQVLIRIDDEEYKQIREQAKSLLEADQAQLAQVDVEEENLNRLIKIARSEFDIAQREYQRVNDLFDRALAQKREYDLSRLALEQTRRALLSLENSIALLPKKREQLTASSHNHRANIALAQLNVDRCRIVAPFDGQVDELFVEIGERIRMGELLLTLLDPDLIEVPIELPVSARQSVRVGSKCKLSMDSLTGRTWTGRVKRVSPTANESTRTFKLYVEVINSEQSPQLVPGFFVQALVEGLTLENVLVIPRGIIQQGRVFVFEDGRAYSRNVQVERHLLDQSVVSGLKAGGMVITSNLDALFEGAPARLEEVVTKGEEKPTVYITGELPTVQK